MASDGHDTGKCRAVGLRLRAMPALARILIVDDDDALRDTLDDFLSSEGYSVSHAANVLDARAALQQAEPDLLLLDINMPGGDGLSLAGELRSRTTLPIVILSGKGSLVDRVVGLEVGADDYLAKPFELRELLARVRAVLRRAKPASAATEAEAQERRAHFDAFILTPSRRDVSTTAGAKVELTGAEFNLALTFVERPNRILTREAIGAAMNKDDWESFDRSVDTLVSRLRRKLTRHARQPDLIQTVRGEGYVLAAPVRWSGPKE
jgi:DNA-binding response OmpR family regulator